MSVEIVRKIGFNVYGPSEKGEPIAQICVGISWNEDQNVSLQLPCGEEYILHPTMAKALARSILKMLKEGGKYVSVKQ